MTAEPFATNLKTALGVAGQALNDYEAYLHFGATESRTTYPNAFQRFPTFFKDEGISRFRALIIGLYQLAEDGKKKITIPNLISAAADEKVIDQTLADALHAEFKLAAPISEGVNLIRNNHIGHLGTSLTLEELYKKANLKTNDLEKLAMTYVVILNQLADKASVTKVNADNRSNTIHNELKAIFDRLNA